MRFAGLLVVALVAIAAHGSPTGSKSCTLNIQTQTDPYYEPVIWSVTTKKKKTSYNFVWPTVEDEEGVITIKNKKKLLLGCPLSSKGNSQVTSGQEEAYAICKNGELTINGTEVTTNSTSCTKDSAHSWLNVTDTTCGSSKNSGIIVQIGFKLEDLDDLFMPLFYSCFVVDEAKTLYSYHQLMGGSIEARVTGGGEGSFEEGSTSLWPNVSPAECYPEKDQINTFNTLLGDGAADKYFANNDYLNKGHLAPHADFIFNTQRLATYYYVNCAPQWYNFNAGNWEVVETFSRTIAQDYGTTLDVWTGTYGILELDNMDGEATKVYLDPNNNLIPVPLVYWKLITNPDTNACTVAIGHNNPFLTSAPKSLCKKVKPSGWPTLTSNFTDGYTYYCSYKTFKKVVDYVPDITCKKLLEFPSEF